MVIKMFCEKCGSKLEDNAKFCIKCGAPVKRVKEAEILPSSEIPVIPVPQEPIPVIEVEKTKAANGKKKIIGILLLAAIVLLLVGLLGGLAWYIFSGNGPLLEFGGYGKAKEAAAEDQEDEEGSSQEQEEPEGQQAKEDGEALEDEEASGDVEEASEDEYEVYTGEKTDVNIEVRQVDASNFPEITLYASVTDEGGNTIESMEHKDFSIQEIDTQGNVKDVQLKDVHRVINESNINVNLVLDASGSMDSYSKMPQAKNAAKSLISQMELTSGDKVEVISFDSYVYLEQAFTSQEELLIAAIDNIGTDGTTALYDALYAGLYQTYYEDGAKCVIGFTDGAENASSYTFDDVVNMAQNTGIPVFIIGIGDDYDTSELQEMASLCSGRYYSADVVDLQTILEDIYISIYREQQDYYVLKYTTEDLSNPTQFRDVVVQTSEYTEFSGYYRKSYVPQADISGAFSDSYMNMDFMIDDSGTRTVTEADLAGMSLAQLRIARNEIFARHGRQFKDSMLNQWFYSKVWYLNLPAKYAPDAFDAMSPSPLSRLEVDNANFILNYEKMLMEQQDIYPNAGSTLLSDYDLALSKHVLKRAYAQMENYTSTAILEENKRLVSEAINKEDILY